MVGRLNQRDNSKNVSPFFKGEEIKPLLCSENLTADDLKKHLLLVFGSLRRAGQKAGYGDDVRVHQILTGYKIPKNPDIIRRIGGAWNVDLIILTQLFERLKGEKAQHEDVVPSADPKRKVEDAI